MKKSFKKVALGVLTSTLVLTSMVPTSTFAAESIEERQYESAEDMLQNIGDVRYYDLDLSYTDEYFEQVSPYFVTLKWTEDGDISYSTINDQYKVVTKLDNEYLSRDLNYGSIINPEPYDIIKKVTDIKIAGVVAPELLRDKLGYSNEEIASCQYLIVDLKDNYKVVHTYTAEEFVALGNINSTIIDINKYPELQLRQEVKSIDGRRVAYKFSIVIKGTDSPYGAFSGGEMIYKYTNDSPSIFGIDISMNVWDAIFFTPEFKLNLTHN